MVEQSVKAKSIRFYHGSGSVDVKVGDVPQGILSRLGRVGSIELDDRNDPFLGLFTITGIDETRVRHVPAAIVRKVVFEDGTDDEPARKVADELGLIDHFNKEKA